jgi:hypothetical protein
MLYCTKCGKQNADVAKFCTGCGTTMGNTPLFPDSEHSKKTNSKTWMYIAALAIAGLLVAGYFLLFKKTETKTEKQEQTVQTKEPAGRYPQTSQRLLTSSEVENMTQGDLRIMRNEIFARQGLIFQSADMRNYFMAQPWYNPLYNNVLDRLSDVEKKNVALIKRYESFQEEFGGDFAR